MPTFPGITKIADTYTNKLYLGRPADVEQTLFSPKELSDYMKKGVYT